MTKNSAAKKAARRLAHAENIRYIAARRRLRDDASQASRGSTGALTVLVTYEFTGTDAPAPVQFDAAPLMDRLGRHELDMLRHDGWVYDPNIPERDYLPDFLERAATQAGVDALMQAAADWVKKNTGTWENSFVAPDRDHWNGRVMFEQATAYPYRVVFDGEAAERWVSVHRHVHDLNLIDLVTPAERWEWMRWHGGVNCEAGRHFFDGSPSPYVGECFGCGALMLVRFDAEGNEVEDIVEEAEFFAELAATEAFCNWAPPTRMLRGVTQAEWHERNWPLSQSARLN